MSRFQVTVYCLIDMTTNRPFYVGSTKNTVSREYVHRTASKKSNSPVSKYIRENKGNFYLKGLEVAYCSHKGEQLILENKWYKKLKRNRHTLLNTKTPTGSKRDNLFTDIEFVSLLAKGATGAKMIKLLKTTKGHIFLRKKVLLSKYGCKNSTQLVSVFHKNNFL